MIVRLQGGLGNQLFQAAFGISRMVRRCEPVTFHPFNLGPGNHRPYALSAFSFSFPLTDEPPIGVHMYGEKSFAFDVNAEGQPRGTYFTGNWQSEKYFEEKVIRDVFGRMNVNTPSSILARTAQMGATCSIHVRRTDYLNVQAYHGVMGMEYYNQAIEYIRQRTSKVRFLVFSDDIAWCRSNFTSKDFNFVDCNGFGNGDSGPSTEHQDLYIMSKCTHAIIPNSSFGWWGAWLNPDKSRIVIAPQDWFTPTGPAKDFDTSDLIPERWVRL